MNLGLIGAIGGLGAGTAEVGKKWLDDDSQKERDDRLFGQQSKLEQMRQEFQQRLQAQSQEFQSGENALNRAQQTALQTERLTSDNERGRLDRESREKIAGMHEAGLNARHREAMAKQDNRVLGVEVDGEGNVWRYSADGTKAEPVMLPNGKQMKKATKGEAFGPNEIAKMVETGIITPEQGRAYLLPKNVRDPNDAAPPAGAPATPESRPTMKAPPSGRTGYENATLWSRSDLEERAANGDKDAQKELERRGPSIGQRMKNWQSREEPFN